jgi:multidrug efflux pump subunit AcrB/outer membrane protein TolC
VDATLSEVQQILPPSVKIARVADQPKAVRNSVNHFMRDFVIAIVSVIGVTMLLLPLRVASVAAITIPVSIAISLGILKGLGVDLQTVSLAGLIVVLGMVVDNAIVVVDDHVERVDHGAAPWDAAWQSARGLIVPLVVATAAIMMAYIPLNWFLTGQAADFISCLPLTIVVALTVSLVLALTLVPTLDFWFIKKGLLKQTQGGRPSVLDLLDRVYGKGLVRAFRHPWWVILGLGVGSVLIAGILASRLDQQLFPKVDRDQFAVEVSLPPGRPLTQTDAVVRDLEKLLMSDKRVVNVASFIGTSSPRFHSLYAPEMPNRNYAQLIVNTVSEEATLDVLREYSAHYNSTFPDAWVRWKQLDMQMAKAPIEIRLSGEDVATLKTLGERIKTYASTLPGVCWVRDDYGESRSLIEVLPDLDACARLGITPSVLQLSLAMSSNLGLGLGTVWEGDYPVRVIMAKPPHHVDKIEDLRQAQVPSAFVGAAVPLEQVASVRPSWDEGTIVRRNGIRTYTIRVDLEFGKIATGYQKKLESYIASLGPTPGVSISYGGERQDQEEQYPPMSRALLTSVAVIYFILLLQFRRHLKVLLVMLTMPLALLGAAFGLFVTGAPFGFTSFVGIISLMGIVVRNGVILVDYAEMLRRTQNLSPKEAGLAAGKRRMRPIFLTSAAAAVGVIPMIISGSTLWAPLGAVTAFGLVFSMVLTLFVLPVAYWRVSNLERGPSPLDGPQPGTQAGTIVASLLFLCLVCLPGQSTAQAVPLTLEKCRELAAKQATEVRVAEFEVSSAERTREAVRTRYFPQVSVNASSVRSGSPLGTMSTPGAVIPVVNSTGAETGQTVEIHGGEANIAKRIDSAGITAVQPVFAGGRIANGNRLAVLGVQVAKENTSIARRDAVILAEEKYWGILQLQEKLSTLIAYQELLNELQRQANDAMENGLTTSNDSLKVRTLRSKAEVDRMKLESALRLSARDLCRHLGLPEEKGLVLADGFAKAEPPVPSVDERISGLKNRPELRQLERAVQAEDIQTSLKRGEMLPTVSVGVGAMSNRVSGTKDYDDAMAFALVSVPITGIWENGHAAKAARYKKRIAEARLEDTRSKLRLEIDKCWDDLETAWHGLQSSQLAIEQARVNLREETERYQNGIDDFSDLLEAQVLLHQAQDQQTDSIAAYWVQRSAYRRAIGGL